MNPLSGAGRRPIPMIVSAYLLVMAGRRLKRKVRAAWKYSLTECRKVISKEPAVLNGKQN
jgi:hypothetical protein